jgi:hypothetical protein
MIRHAAATMLLIGITSTVRTSAHCDTTQGPVVTAAKSALGAGDPNLVLHWVRPEDEGSVHEAFRRTLAVRAQGPEAMALADRYFFETVVRIHRAGEGAPFTGITDAPPEPIIAATDRALEHGSADELEQQLVSAVRAGLAERFAAARAKKDFRRGDVAGGREFVAAYVPLTHWVEGVFAIASGTGEHHREPRAQERGPHREPVHGTARDDAPHLGATTRSDPGHRDRYLPWILAGLFAIAASVEGVLLTRRRSLS